MTTGEVLRHERERAGMSQSALAETLGLTQTYISDIESNRRRLGVKYVGLLPADMRVAVRDSIIAELEAEIAAIWIRITDLRKSG